MHIPDDEDMPDEDRGPGYESIGEVGIVALHGIIGKRLSIMETACGGCDLERVEQNLVAAFADANIQAVILDIDSPGGTVAGVDEMRQKIAALSAESGKPCLAFASGQCCSAAYWIACGCSAGIAASSSSDVGSIGVYCACVDDSVAWQMEGLRLVLVKAGKFKAEGISGSQITDEQVARWQQDIDYIYGKFTEAVRTARPGVSQDVMEGQTFYGERAVHAGLADAVYPDLAACLADFAGER
jgi:signal peptide peptidase SppA